MNRISKLIVGSLLATISLSADVLKDHHDKFSNNQEKKIDCSEDGRLKQIATGSLFGLIGGPLGIGIGAISFDTVYNKACKPVWEKEAEEKRIADLAQLRYEEMLKNDKKFAASFDNNSSKILTLSSTITSLLGQNDLIESIEIIGHTSNTGTAGYNYSLGLERANSLKNLLISYGIEKHKLTTRSQSFELSSEVNGIKNQRAEVNIKYKLVPEIIIEKEILDIDPMEITNNY